MELEFVFLRPAENRLTELGLYIADEAGVRIANDYLDRIHAACMALGEFPERGRNRDEILLGLRTITMERRVTIAYRVRRKRVESPLLMQDETSLVSFAGGDNLCEVCDTKFIAPSSTARSP